MQNRSKIIVGLSGGVDSAVAACLLRDAGHDVIGVTLRTWESETGEESRCCEIDDAREIANSIGIPFHTFNCVSRFKRCVAEPFVEDYINGLTPNPCIECNRYVKWERMIHAALVLGADQVATGHYAYVVRLDNGRYTVRRAAHAAKDQTYMLYRLTQEQLSRTVMPLGPYTKDQVRRIAAERGLPVASKSDSQEICFVPDDDYAGYVEANAGDRIRRSGEFVDVEGNVLGIHRGIIHYTVGQRKGLGIAMGRPVYVKAIIPEKDQVVLADEDDLMSRRVICDRLNFLSIDEPAEGEVFRCEAKIRYHHRAQAAAVEIMPDGRAAVLFDEPVRAAAPGQSAVFYDSEDNVIGGGIIRGAE